MKLTPSSFEDHAVRLMMARVYEAAHTEAARTLRRLLDPDWAFTVSGAQFGDATSTLEAVTAVCVAIRDALGIGADDECLNLPTVDAVRARLGFMSSAAERLSRPEYFEGTA